MSDLALPGQTSALFAKMQGGWHPALLLDKYTAPSGEKSGQNKGLELGACACHDKYTAPSGEKSGGGQKEALEKILRAGEAPDLLKTALHRQSCFLASVTVLDLKTAGPLTLHLSRANALENAGLAFHPVYGFAYLPGSGIKGLTRAWAEQMAKADKTEIERVFGHAAGDQGAAGAVVFHDALPTRWPKLRLEITTSHHRDYYSGKAAPGDWESPNPVVFLAVAPDTCFRFALSPARGDTEAVAKALAWLQAALCHAGAGAKTASGYGRFVVANPPPIPEALATRDVTLELVTPAFLAGAEQQKDDCDLHVGTLRGQLRWWWRTLHAGHVPLDELRRLEKLVWGGLSGFGGKEGRGSAVALHLPRQAANAAVLFDKKSEAKKHNIPSPRDRKTIMGLHYGAYGMDETPKRRNYLPEKTQWRVQISARASDGIEAKTILTQALAALWLLCRFGGVGSKSRKGWGSLADITIPELRDLAACKNAAREFRAAAGAKSGGVADAMTIEAMILAERALPNAPDPWHVLDHAGTLLQTFAKNLSSKEDRLALGLPRRIGGRPGTALKGPKGERHASPAHFHVARADKGFVLRLAAFPAACLPNREKSGEILGKLAESVKTVPAAPQAGATAPASRSMAPQSSLLPSVGSLWLYNEEQVRVSRQIPPNKVEIEDENGEFIAEVPFSSLKPLPK